MNNKNNTGALWKNTRKNTTKHPDYTGKIILNNTLYRVAAWLSKSEAGDSYLVLRLSPAPPEWGGAEITEDSGKSGVSSQRK